MIQKFKKIDENAPLVYADIKACRRNALTESELPWPVYCAYDEIREAYRNFFRYAKLRTSPTLILSTRGQ